MVSEPLLKVSAILALFCDEAACGSILLGVTQTALVLKFPYLPTIRVASDGPIHLTYFAQSQMVDGTRVFPRIWCVWRLRFAK